MLKTFDSHISQNLDFLKKSKLLLAISGGLDSVVLTHLCQKLKLNVSLAHCNFKLRGSESDSDEAFVLDLAEDLDLEVFIETFDTEAYALHNKISIQIAARTLRYEWFYDLANQLGFDYILTAHHADDNLETLLINLTRGTGLKGLTGIPEINDKLVRPLLPFAREALEAFALKNAIHWQEDSSNASKKYLRNKLRHDVIPTLKAINPHVLENFKTTIAHLKESADIIDDTIRDLSARSIASSEKGVTTYRISELKKLKQPKTYLYQLFKDYGFSEWNDVHDLLEAQSGKQVFSKTHRLLKDREHLILTKIEPSANQAIDDFLEVKATDAKLKTPMGTLFFDEADAIFGKRTNVVFVDRDALKFPLTLRKWQEGDVFYPLGMKGKKKLSKYFKDEKLSLIEKERVWVLCSENQIVWVLGRRADDRFKVSSTTRSILKITLL